MIKILPLSTSEILAIILVTVAFIISYKAIKKRGENFKGIRKAGLYILHFISTTALLGLILQPQIKLTNKDMNSEKVRLITNNSILNISDSDYPTYTLTPLKNDNNITEIKSAQQILLRHPELTQIEIIGEGLSNHDWKGFEEIKISYQQPELIRGLQDVSWNKVINLGDTLKFSARYQDNSSNLFIVQLFDPAGDKVAEKKVRANEYFNFTTQPKISGLHQYKVKLLNDKTQMLTENINLRVRNQSQAKILILQSSPSFETKQLQNWAAENGAQMMIKTQISQDKYMTRLTNLNAVQQNQLSTQLFDYFDMLVIDGRALINLSSVEVDWLTSSVKQGLGVLVLADNELIEVLKPNRKHHQLPLLQGYQLEHQKNKDEVIIFWPDNNGDFQISTEEFLPKLSASISVSQSEQLNIQRLVESETNELIVAKSDFGLGQVALSLIKSTHSWVTSGNNNIHSQYWSHLIANIARKSDLSVSYPVSNTTLSFAEKLTKQCISSEDDIKQLTLSHRHDKNIKQFVLLQQSQASNKQQCGYFWPQQHGWYQITADSMKETANKLSGWRYIEDKSNWLAIQQMGKTKATLSKLRMNSGIKSRNAKATYQPINLWYFWWMLFISASFIWLERKLD